MSCDSILCITSVEGKIEETKVALISGGSGVGKRILNPLGETKRGATTVFAIRTGSKVKFKEFKEVLRKLQSFRSLQLRGK